ncbi:ClpP/crotonase-like domain-containing protein [Myxozyma melibiosi]|uniref:ClpP/crotonase-like domain-containing protein n=1 Tax=Myxozyma melibiosi TaxID=54550 RepID=A0ABR1FE16_9ASCO
MVLSLPAEFQIYDDPAKGSITVSKADSGQYYLLTFGAPPDNRLTPEICLAFLYVLDVIEDQLLPEQKLPLVTTSKIAKFYSNGLDLERAMTTPGFWDERINPLFKRLLEYPTPLVAMINGHAFAGGFMFALCHDYRIMNPDKGFLCANELEFGSPLPPPMSAIFREKTAVTTYQKIAIEATRFNADMALEHNLIHAKGHLSDVDAFIKANKLTKFAQSPSYGLLKAQMWRDIVKYCDEPHEQGQQAIRDNISVEEKRKKVRADEYKKAKL